MVLQSQVFNMIYFHYELSQSLQLGTIIGLIVRVTKPMNSIIIYMLPCIRS